jgi:predicted glycosyltransferase
MIPPGQLTAERLAAEITRCLATPPPGRPVALDMQGAERTALFLAELVS